MGGGEAEAKKTRLPRHLLQVLAGDAARFWKAKMRKRAMSAAINGTPITPRNLRICRWEWGGGGGRERGEFITAWRTSETGNICASLFVGRILLRGVGREAETESTKRSKKTASLAHLRGNY